MTSNTLPSLGDVKKYYDISFMEYSIAILHPVTTESINSKINAKIFVDALIQSNDSYVVIYPNNDFGSNDILNEYERLKDNDRFKIFPSLRFEYFLVLLKHSSYIVGNSSAGIREAPFYNVPTVDIGSRQSNRSKGYTIFHASDDLNSITESISSAKNFEVINKNQDSIFGKGNSDEIFLNLLNGEDIWSSDCQKLFQDIDYEKN
jgi:UDP-N-acetylglucosamine 2-epimerase (hydrolysing)